MKYGEIRSWAGCCCDIWWCSVEGSTDADDTDTVLIAGVFVFAVSRYLAPLTVPITMTTTTATRHHRNHGIVSPNTSLRCTIV